MKCILLFCTITTDAKSLNLNCIRGRCGSLMCNSYETMRNKVAFCVVKIRHCPISRVPVLRD